MKAPRNSWLTGFLLVLLVLPGCKRQAGDPPPKMATPVADTKPADPPDQSQPSNPSGSSDRADPSDRVDPSDRAAPSQQPDPSDQASPSGQAEQSAAAGPEVIFENWPTPRLALFITGQQHGYIEPCGCTGLDNQKGGLARRHRLALELAERGWPVLPVDAGNQVRRFGRQAEIKFQMTVEGMRQIGYRGAGLGIDDLRLSVGELLATTTGDESPFVCVNAAVLDMTPKFRVATVNGMRIGIVSVIGTENQQQITAAEITKSPPDTALDQILPQLQSANCQLHVLLAQASVAEARRLGNKYPDFKIVVAAGGEDPTYQPQQLETGAIFMQTGMKSKYVMVVGVFGDQQAFRYQRVPLDKRFEDTAPMLDLLASYQDQLKTLGLAGLGLKPIPHPSGAQFVGSQRCGECHESAYQKWLTTPHHKATQALVEPSERIAIPRHHDPECLSCHVTGWHPQRYFPYVSGYLGLQESPLLHGNGCENCHGPGSQHVAAHAGELDVSDDMMRKLNEAMRLPLDAADQKCLECHDLDNDPNFQEPGAFEEYWEQIKHGMD